MTEQFENETQEIAARQAGQRRSEGRGWLAVLGFTLLTGIFGWALTRDAAWLVVCGFLAVYPVLMLLYTHFYLLNPWAAPTTIQERIKKRAEAQQRAPAEVLRANGMLFVVTSPVFFILGVGAGLEEAGMWGAVLGALFGVFCLGAGIGAIAWSKRW